jgi:hypothetical protein
MSKSVPIVPVEDAVIKAVGTNLTEAVITHWTIHHFHVTFIGLQDIEHSKLDGVSIG